MRGQVDAWAGGCVGRGVGVCGGQFVYYSATNTIPFVQFLLAAYFSSYILVIHSFSTMVFSALECIGM